MSRAAPLAILVGAALACALTLAACQTPIRESLSGVPRPASLWKAFDLAKGKGGPSGVTLISDPATAWAARWELLRDAKSTIESSYFIVEDDIFGMAFLGHLYKKAKSGVDVKLLIDGRGSIFLAAPLMGRDFLQELVATGHVDVHVFNPAFSQVLRSLLEVNAVPVSAGTHNKILVVDGALAMTGGRNIGKVYFSRFDEEPTAVVDADVLVDGADAVREVAAVMRREFPSKASAEVGADLLNFVSKGDTLLMVYGAMDAWLAGTVPMEPYDDAVLALEAAGLAQIGQLPDRGVRDEARPYLRALAHHTAIYGKSPLDAQDRHEGEVRVVSAMSRAVRLDDSANDALVRAIGGAEKSIMLESPYFILTPRVMHALERASARGVVISVITNSPISSDNSPSQALFIDTWPELMARIPTLRIYVTATRQMIHAKRAVFDEQLTLIGTYNLDPFSAHINSEMMLGVWSSAFNSQNRAELDLLRHSNAMIEYRIVRDERRRPRRHPKGDPRAGQVMVAYGPRDHVPPELIDELLALKQVLISIRNLWDFKVVVW